MPEAVHIPWQPIGGGRASEAIYDQLRELITSGVLKPGDRLPSERAMMEQLHRSRPTIREALRMLEHHQFQRSAIPVNASFGRCRRKRLVQSREHTLGRI